MLTKLKNIFKLKRKPLSVKAEIRRDPNIDKYISAYGHREDSPTSIGSGRTLEDALKDTADKINSPEKQDITERQRILDGTESVPLKINLYYNEIEENYVLAIEDTNGTTIEGSGRNTSKAFRSLAENVQLNQS